jgi:hypothetical protein
MMRKQRIRDTYCVRISLVSAPGWSSLFLFLQGSTFKVEQGKNLGKTSMNTLTLYATLVRAGCADQRAVNIPVRAEALVNEPEVNALNKPTLRS